MRLRKAGIAVVSLIALAASVGLTRSSRSPGLTVHEWGTFTTVAGTSGAAIDWLPLGGPNDLPCFVKHVRSEGFIYRVSDTSRPVVVTRGPVTKGEVVVGSSTASAMTYEEARRNLWGKVRMETPVIYFYSPTAQSAHVSVKFPQGVITEFYPSPQSDAAPLSLTALRTPGWVHTMNWDVQVAPTTTEVFPNGGEASHYYAARATDATPIRVGAESEKFIFYRGVANFEAPIRVLTTGDSVLIVNAQGTTPLPAVILFESRNGRMGFRALGAVTTHITVSHPELTSNTEKIRAELYQMLVDGGLYPKEATAMLDTWHDSWFEEGTRVFYLLPREKVDAVLPLQITPAPANVARVFVGRMEVIDAATTDAVQSALETNDGATLARYARFLNPIADRIVARGADAATTNRIYAAANDAYARYNRDARRCDDLSARNPARE
jgi:hypothetical protein